MTAPTSRRTVTLAATLLASALSAPFCFRPIGQSDAGFHLALGRLFAREGLTFHNAIGWTAPDFPWYPASYVYDLISYGLVHALGPFGFQLWTALLLVGTIALVAFACGELDAWGAWFAVPAALLVAPRATERPHMVSWLVIAGVLALCIAAKTRGWGARARWACLPVIAVGSNFHAGAVFGTGILGLFCLEALVQEKPRRWREVAIAAGGGLAVLANPGGLFTLMYSVDHLSVQNVVVLAEFLPPTWRDYKVFFVLLPLTLLALLPHARRWPALLGATAVFGALGLFAIRNTFEFYLVAAPGLALGLSALRQRLGAPVALAIPLLAVVAFEAGPLPVWLRTLRFEGRFDPEALPVRAAAFARAEGLTGRYFNSFRDGGYLEYALDQPAFQDGRVLAWPHAFFARLKETEARPAAFLRLMRELDVEWAFATRRNEPLGGYTLFRGSPEWALVYCDDLSEVYLRRDVPRFAPTLARLEYRFFRPDNTVVGRVVQAPPGQLPSYLDEVERFERTTPGDPLAALVRCAALRRMGAGAAESACEEAARRAPTAEFQRLVARARQLPPAGAPPKP